MTGLGFDARNPLAWLPLLSAAAIAGNGLRLRARVRALAVLPAGVGRDASGDEERRSSPAEQGRDWLVAGGVALDAATRAAAEAHQAAEGLDVLDVIPADLPVDEALALLRMVDPATYRSERLAAGRGAGQAVLAGEAVLRRAEIKPGEAVDPAAILADTAELKKFAPASSAHAVAPALRAGDVGSPRARRLAQGIPAAFALTGPLVSYAALAAGTVANPLWGAAALAVFSAQPALVFSGTPVKPRDLLRASLLRVLRDPIQLCRTAAGARGALAEARAGEARARREEARPGYAADLAGGVDRFFEPRRPDCPWCGATSLARIVSTPDLHQGKPGRFVLKRCRRCGHVFQNPRLTIAGLEFYYRDFYDGAGEHQLEGAFGAQAKTYRSRAEMLRPHVASPASWLDVGTGHGHFCCAARQVWPGTRFDGLDMTDGIKEAARRGWVDRGLRGMFPDLAGGLAGRYDVVSMSHYLEHTREPATELDAAATALKPGGHLFVEVPDPEWPVGRILRRYWLPWLQPQHQHLIPIGNLKQALAARGLVPVAERRDMNPVPFDLGTAVYLLLHRLARDPDVAWSARPPGPARQALRGVAIAVEIPLLLAAGIADIALSLALLPLRRGTAYRLVARKEAPAR
jgi:SAM-dependent methyltransferase